MADQFVLDPILHRVLIIDASHMAHQFAHSSHSLWGMSPSGQRVNTTVQSGVVKTIHRWSRAGFYPTLVAFDRPCPHRKAFLQDHFGEDYKGGRKRNYAIQSAMQSAEEILREGGVSVLAVNGYEADDVVAAGVASAKVKYPGWPIDIVTNDMDLVPLVDDQVSVFIRSPRGTWAENEAYRRNKYIQITPANYQEQLEVRSAFKTSKLKVPYNSVFLAKLLRGDNSDNLKSPAKAFCPPKVYNQIVTFFQEDRGISSIVPDGGETTMKIVDALTELFEPDTLRELLKFWQVLELNAAFPATPTLSARKPLPLFDFLPYSASKLSRSASAYQINLQ